MVKYERIYQILRNKIECGLIPVGTELPGRGNLCKEFNTSERTARRVVELLAQDGLLKITPKKRPVVISNLSVQHQKTQQTMEKADAVAANDILKTSTLLCYPINNKGMSLCKGDDWNIPEKIVANMDPYKPIEFWRLSNRLWRFFISRNENELILRAVDSLGLGNVDPLPGTFEMRKTYHTNLKELIQTMKQGKKPQSVYFDTVSLLYGIVLDEKEGTPSYQVTSDSPLRIGLKELDQKIYKAQERYSSVYLDIIGLIAMGRYQFGERLPTHENLRKIYGVSIDTTVKAIRILQKWGVVTATPKRGIFVAMNLDMLQKIPIDPELIACHVRRYLDTLELLSLTIQEVAAHAAAYVTPEEAKILYKKLNSQWNEPHQHQLIPRILLDFIAEHIQYDALRSIYKVIQKNYVIGRSIPKLVARDKTSIDYTIYQQCIEIATILIDGDISCFAKQSAELFHTIYDLIIKICKKLGYLEAAMQVYDGTALWK